MTKKLGFWISLLFLSKTVLAPVLAQEAQFAPMREDRGTESRCCDLLRIHLKLRLDEMAQTLEGEVIQELEALREGISEIWFDCVGLEIQEALVDGNAAAIRQEPNRIFIPISRPLAAGEHVTVTIRYRGHKPDRGLWFIAPDENDPALLHEIWSQGQSEDNRYWIPTWDYPTDRATFVGEFTVRPHLTVVSNGALVEKRPESDSWVTWIYSLDFPFATYLISVCVGSYERYVDHWGSIPVEYYVQKGVGEDTARRSFSDTPDVLEFFSEFTGVPYPYPKYAQTAVQRFVAGGMENISATTQSDRTLHDAREHLDRTSRGLVAHEAAHQWFGDYVTCRTWRHLWLNEGFANFMDALYTRRVEGVDAYRLELRGQQRSAMSSDRKDNYRAMVEEFFTRRQEGSGNNAVYVKGCSVLGMIHSILGDDAMRRALKHYLTKNAGRLVDTADFECAIEEATGVNLHWLFTEYVYLAGHPIFEVEQSYDASKQEVVLKVKQVQEGSELIPVFRYPVPIEVTCDGWKELTTVWVNQKEQEIRLKAPSEPLMVCFDKGSAMLKEVRFKKSTRELLFQARNDDDVCGRLSAVEELASRKEEIADVTAALAAVLTGNDHHEVREAAVRSLAELKGEGTVTALLTSISDPKSSVRSECVSALGRLKEQAGAQRDAVVQAVLALLQKDLSYRVQSSSASTLAEYGGDAVLAALHAASVGETPRDQVESAALRARIKLEDPTVVGELVTAAKGEGVTPRRKTLAMGLVGSLNEAQLGDRKGEVVALLMETARNGKGDARVGAVRGLGRLKVQEARELIESYAKQDNDRRLKFAAANVLRDNFGDAAGDAVKPAPTMETLTETLNALQAQFQRMEQRLETMEKQFRAQATAAGGGS